MNKRTRKQLRRFVGKYVYGLYPAPAITCEMNGHMVRPEGKVTGVGTDSMGHEGVIIEGHTVLSISAIKCPTLHWEGEVYKRRNA